MQTRVKAAVEILGAQALTDTPGALTVSVPPKSRAASLFPEGDVHHLAFSPDGADDESILVHPGGGFVQSLADALSETPPVCHGVLASPPALPRKEMMNQLSLFLGEVKSFSAIRSWLTRVRYYFKTAVTTNETIEDIICVECGTDGCCRQVGAGHTWPGGQAWTARPPVQKKQLKEKEKNIVACAEKIVADMAESARVKNTAHLYETIKRLRLYYGQLRKETKKDGADEDAIRLIEDAYQRRKIEAVDHCGVSATIQVIAVETLSIPAKNLKWHVQRSGVKRVISATMDLHAGKPAVAFFCEVCGGETPQFGLTQDGRLACEHCVAICSFCDAEMAGHGAALDHQCPVCGKTACPDHMFQCRNCHMEGCADHVRHCREGCPVCDKCTKLCPDCGDGVFWCPDHCRENSKNQITCARHAVSCIGCKEPYAASQTWTCAACGQTVCRDCRAVCRECGGVFCFNHTYNGRCASCHPENQKNQRRSQHQRA